MRLVPLPFTVPQMVWVSIITSGGTCNVNPVCDIDALLGLAQIVAHVTTRLNTDDTLIAEEDNTDLFT